MSIDDNNSGSAYLPLARIRKKLFDDGTWSAEIRKRYLIVEPISGKELEQKIFEILGQSSRGSQQQSYGENDVFKAMAMAIGSNQRSWSLFKNKTDKFSDLLLAYSVKDLASVLASDSMAGLGVDIACHLGGRTKNKDAAAILACVTLLRTSPDFYEHLLQIKRFIAESVIEATPSELTAGTALAIGTKLKLNAPIASQFKIIKIPGMGATLAAEFLRNLGWSGFKPDTHIRRLLRNWYFESESWKIAKEAVRRFEVAFGKINNMDSEFLHYSTLGEKLTPPGEDVNRADQLVWLYGSVLREKANAFP